MAGLPRESAGDALERLLRVDSSIPQMPGREGSAAAARVSGSTMAHGTMGIQGPLKVTDPASSAPVFPTGNSVQVKVVSPRKTFSARSPLNHRASAVTDTSSRMSGSGSSPHQRHAFHQ